MMATRATSWKPEQLVDLIDKLQDWLESFKDLSEVPAANVTWSAWTVDIAVGDVCLWSDQEDLWGDLSLDWLKVRWIEHCREISKFLKQPSEEPTDA